jgi:predicted RNA polymerase sigma factor
VEDEDEMPIEDERLRLIFTVCTPRSRRPPGRPHAALRGRPVDRGGGAAVHVAEPTMAARLTRARPRSHARGSRTDAAGGDLAERQAACWPSLPRLHGGLRAARGERVVRGELCEEAIRSAGAARAHAETRRPRAALTHAPDHARSAARTGRDGDLVLLAGPGPRVWDGARLARGSPPAAAARVGPYALQAGSRRSTPCRRRVDRWRAIAGCTRRSGGPADARRPAEPCRRGRRGDGRAPAGAARGTRGPARREPWPGDRAGGAAAAGGDPGAAAAFERAAALAANAPVRRHLEARLAAVPRDR